MRLSRKHLKYHSRSYSARPFAQRTHNSYKSSSSIAYLVLHSDVGLAHVASLFDFRIQISQCIGGTVLVGQSGVRVGEIDIQYSK